MSLHCTKNNKSTRFMKNVNYLCTYAEKKDSIRKSLKILKILENKNLKKLKFSQRNCKKPH